MKKTRILRFNVVEMILTIQAAFTLERIYVNCFNRIIVFKLLRKLSSQLWSMPCL